MERFLFTSESVTEGHPDKMCDQISDAILDAFISEYGSDEIADAIDIESEEYDEAAASASLTKLIAATPADASVPYELEDEETKEGDSNEA